MLSLTHNQQIENLGYTQYITSYLLDLQKLGSVTAHSVSEAALPHHAGRMHHGTALLEGNLAIPNKPHMHLWQTHHSHFQESNTLKITPPTIQNCTHIHSITKLVRSLSRFFVVQDMLFRTFFGFFLFKFSLIPP